MPGMDRYTGAPLAGWAEVEQSIAVILTTPIGSRVMRREFGSELMDLIGRPMTSDVILAVYAATAQAIARWEPRFVLTGVELSLPSADGSLSLSLRGTYRGDVVSADILLGA